MQPNSEGPNTDFGGETGATAPGHRSIADLESSAYYYAKYIKTLATFRASDQQTLLKKSRDIAAKQYPTMVGLELHSDLDEMARNRLVHLMMLHVKRNLDRQLSQPRNQTNNPAKSGVRPMSESQYLQALLNYERYCEHLIIRAESERELVPLRLNDDETSRTALARLELDVSNITRQNQLATDALRSLRLPDQSGSENIVVTIRNSVPRLQIQGFETTKEGLTNNIQSATTELSRLTALIQSKQAELVTYRAKKIPLYHGGLVTKFVEVNKIKRDIVGLQKLEQGASDALRNAQTSYNQFVARQENLYDPYNAVLRSIYADGGERLGHGIMSQGNPTTNYKDSLAGQLAHLQNDISTPAQPILQRVQVYLGRVRDRRTSPAVVTALAKHQRGQQVSQISQPRREQLVNMSMIDPTIIGGEFDPEQIFLQDLLDNNPEKLEGATDVGEPISTWEEADPVGGFEIIPLNQADEGSTGVNESPPLPEFDTERTFLEDEEPLEPNQVEWIISQSNRLSIPNSSDPMTLENLIETKTRESQFNDLMGSIGVEDSATRSTLESIIQMIKAKSGSDVLTTEQVSNIQRLIMAPAGESSQSLSNEERVLGLGREALFIIIGILAEKYADTVNTLLYGLDPMTADEQMTVLNALDANDFDDEALGNFAAVVQAIMSSRLAPQKTATVLAPGPVVVEAREGEKGSVEIKTEAKVVAYNEYAQAAYAERDSAYQSNQATVEVGLPAEKAHDLNYENAKSSFEAIDWNALAEILVDPELDIRTMVQDIQSMTNEIFEDLYIGATDSLASPEYVQDLDHWIPVYIGNHSRAIKLLQDLQLNNDRYLVNGGDIKLVIAGNPGLSSLATFLWNYALAISKVNNNLEREKLSGDVLGNVVSKISEMLTPTNLTLKLSSPVQKVVVDREAGDLGDKVAQEAQKLLNEVELELEKQKLAQEVQEETQKLLNEVAPELATAQQSARPSVELAEASSGNAKEGSEGNDVVNSGESGDPAIEKNEELSIEFGAKFLEYELNKEVEVSGKEKAFNAMLIRNPNNVGIQAVLGILSRSTQSIGVRDMINWLESQKR